MEAFEAGFWRFFGVHGLLGSIYGTRITSQLGHTVRETWHLQQHRYYFTLKLAGEAVLADLLSPVLQRRDQVFQCRSAVICQCGQPPLLSRPSACTPHR